MNIPDSLMCGCMDSYRRLQNVCNRKVKSEKATAFLIWMILLFSVVSEQSEPRFCFSVAYILQSPVYTRCNFVVLSRNSYRLLDHNIIDNIIDM